MTIFHGPLVESSFNLMGDIIDPRSTSMNISTFISIQTVKYTLQPRKQSPVEMFSRDNVMVGAVDRRLRSNINSAGIRDKAQRQTKMLRVAERRKEFVCQPSTSAADKRFEVVEEENVQEGGTWLSSENEPLKDLYRPKE